MDFFYAFEAVLKTLLVFAVLTATITFFYQKACERGIFPWPDTGAIGNAVHKDLEDIRSFLRPILECWFGG